MSLKKRMAAMYKTTRVTNLIDEDVLLLKKINTLFQRLEKTDKDRYILEIINILRMLTNVFIIKDLYLLLYESVDIKYHETINFLMEEIDNKYASVTIIRRMQGLSDEQ